ncbi:MAG: hypothetical protein J6B62_02580, partial [Bacteroidales bacterium]|nr:hypothetical protein [Bacteroidales bacterium]
PGTGDKSQEESAEHSDGELFGKEEIEQKVPDGRKRGTKEPKPQRPGFWTKLKKEAAKTAATVGTLFNDAYDNISDNINSDNL